MMLSIVPTRATLFALVVVSTVGVSGAEAMPASPPASGIGGVAGLLRRTAEDQHRVYPGSESADAKRKRTTRMAPNKFCQKHEQSCD